MDRKSGYRRIVVKAGTALITGGSDALDNAMLSNLVEQIARLQSEGCEMLLVSSGAVAAGRSALGAVDGARRGDVNMKQVHAAIGQGLIMAEYERLFGQRGVHVAQALLTGRDLDDREGYLNVRNTLMGLIELGVTPIINENDVVSVNELGGEIFGDNDMLSAMVANIVDADLLLMLGQLDGLFTADPNLDPAARPISIVERFTDEIDALGGPSADGRGRGGMTTKLEAARLATASGVDTIMASGRREDVILRAAGGERSGTYFPARATRMESRKRYLLSQMRESDAALVDEGAARAVAYRNSSLLAAGIVDVVGEFERGDVVMVMDGERHTIACGISNYGAGEIRRIRGLRSDQIRPTLGYYFGDEVLHRDNMVTLG